MEILRAEERFTRELHFMGKDKFWVSTDLRLLPKEKNWNQERVSASQNEGRDSPNQIGPHHIGGLQIAFAKDEAELADKQQALEALQRNKQMQRNLSDSSGDRSQTPSRKEEDFYSGGEQTPHAKEEGLGLEGLAQVCLDESEKAKQSDSSERITDASESSGGGSSDIKGGEPGAPPMHREQHADSMRWRGGAGNVEETKAENVSSGREDDTSSGGSSHKRARGGKGSPESIDELSSESPGKRSRGAPQRQKGGTLGETTVQSGVKRKQMQSESSESVRQEDSDKLGNAWGSLSPPQKVDAPRLPGLGRIGGGYHTGEKDEHFGGWKKVLDGKKTIYECRFCEKRFTVSQALGGHMNRHRLERENEKEMARATAHAKRDVQEKQATSKAHPPVQSPSTPLNLPEAVWGVSQGLETSPNLAPLPGPTIPSLQTEVGKAAFCGTLPPVLQPGGLGTYEAGFEAGFGAGLVALARAGLLVPDAMVALGWQGASAEREQKFVQTPAVQNQAALQMKPGPSDAPSLSFNAELSLGLKAGIDGLEAPMQRLPAVGTSSPAVMPVWVDTPKGQQQVFQVEGVKGLDKGLYALRPYRAQPEEEPSPDGGIEFSRLEGGGNENKAKRFGFEALGKTEEKGLGFQQQEFGRFTGNPIRPSMLRHNLVQHDAPTRVNSPVKLSVGFKAAYPSTLPVTSGGFPTKAGGLKFSPHQAEVGSRFRATNRDAEPIDAISEDECKPPPRAPSSQELLGRQASLPRGGLFSPSPALLQSNLSILRQPSDLYQELLQSQPSLFGPSLGDVGLSGTFDLSLGNFAQDHPDWPDYFQGGSVNGGDAFGNPGQSGTS